MNSRTPLPQLIVAIFAITMLAFGAPPSVAGTNQWSAVGPPGGSVTKIVYNPTSPTNVYLVGAGGFYRSTDGGTTWTNVSLGVSVIGQSNDIAVDPTDGSRVYVAGPSAPYISTDGGATLTRSASFPTLNSSGGAELAITPDGMTLYFATTDMRIFRSTDHGQTWQERTPISTGAVPHLYRMGMDPSDPKTLYAAGATDASTGTFGFLVTHDGAKTWTSADPNHLLPQYVRDIAFNPALPGQIWVATDGGIWASGDSGAHWSQSGAPNLTDVLVFDPSRNGVMYCGTGYGFLWRSADTGASWTDVSGTSNLSTVSTFAVNPANGQSSHVLVGGYGGLLGSSNSGATWVPQETGIFGNNVTGLSADAGSDRVYLNSPSGGFHYLPGGASATAPVNNRALDQLDTGQPHSSFSTAFLAQQGQSGAPGQLLVSLITGIARSADGGNTWSLTGLPNTVSSDQMQVFASSPRTQQVILASSYGTVIRSIDGGATFTQLNTSAAGLPANAFFNLLVASQTDGSVLYGAPLTQPNFSYPPQEYGLYRSNDAGLTWAPVSGLGSNSIVTVTFDPTNAQTVYVSTQAAWLKSTDGGNSWSPLTWNDVTIQYPNQATAAPPRLAIDPHNTRIFFASGAGLSRSVDGGSTWQPLPSITQGGVSGGFVLDPNRPSTVLGGTDFSGLQALTVAPDLALHVTAPTATTLQPGSPASYSFVVSNNGPYDATGVSLTIAFPASTGVSASVSPSGAGSCTSGNTGVNCTFTAMRAAFFATVNLSVTPTTEGAFAVTSSVQGDQPDSDTSNNRVTTSINASLPTDLSVTVSGASTAQVGDAVNYTVSVSNAGSNAATSSQLIFQAASGMTLTGATPSAGSCTTDAPNAKVTCALGDIAASQAVSVTVKGTAATAGAEVSTATVTTTRTDIQPSNNTASVTTTVTTPPPVTANDTGTVQAGQAVTISVLANDTDSNGTVNSGSVRIVNQPTKGTVTINSSGTITYTANAGATTSDSFTYTVDDMQGNRSAPATVSVTIAAPPPANNGGGSSTGSSGGGGGLGALELLALGGLAWRLTRRRARRTEAATRVIPS